MSVMRFGPFHSLLALSIAVAVTGVALGLEARAGSADDDLAGPRAVALHHAPLTRMPVERAIAPPLPVAPRFGADVAGAPSLSWRLAEGTDGARVELCPTNDFADATTRHLDVEGEHVGLPVPWPAGVWYWRLRGRAGGVLGDRATPTWMVYVSESSSASLDGAGITHPILLHGPPGTEPTAPPQFLPSSSDGVEDPQWYAKVAALIDEAHRPGRAPHVQD